MWVVKEFVKNVKIEVSQSIALEIKNDKSNTLWLIFKKTDRHTYLSRWEMTIKCAARQPRSETNAGNQTYLCFINIQIVCKMFRYFSLNSVQVLIK